MSDFVTDSVLNSLAQIANVGNGFEIWRRFAFDHKGGDRELREDGQMRFVNFPHCPDLAKLSQKLEEWEHLRRTHCLGMPDAQTFMLLMRMIPAQELLDIELKGEITTTA